MIPMFRVRSNGTAALMSRVPGIVLGVWRNSPPPSKPLWSQCSRSLPAVVRERLVRVCHLVDVFALLHRVATVLRRIDDLVREAVLHRLLVAVAGVLDQPAHTERQ